MRRRGAVIFFVFAFLLILLLGGGLLYVRTRMAQEQIRAFAERTLARELDLPVQLERFSFSLSVGRVELRTLAVLDRTAGVPLLSVDRVRIQFVLPSLLRGHLRITSLAIRGPRLTIEDTPLLRETLSGVAARLVELARGREAARFPVRVEDGAIRYRNASAALSVEAGGLQVQLSHPTPDRSVVAVVAESVAVTRGERGLAGIKLEGQARVGRDVVELERFRLVQGGSSLVWSGVVSTPFESPRVELDTTGELALEELAAALRAGKGWSGKLAVSGKLFGEGIPRTFMGSLRLADGTIGGIPARLAGATVSLRPERWEVASLTARAGGGSLRGSGVVEPREGRWRGSVELADIDLPELLQAVRRPATLAGRVSGKVEGSGQGRQVAQWALRLNLSGRDLRLADGERRAQGQLEGQLDKGLLRVDRLTLARGQSQLALRGTLNLRNEAVALTATVTVADLANDLWPREVKGLEGRLALSGRVGQTLSRPLFTGQVRARNFRVKLWRADLVAGPVEGERWRVASRGLKVTAARTVATLSGEARLGERGFESDRWLDTLQVALNADLRGRIEDLAAWSQQEWPVAGPIVLGARLRGGLTSLEGGGQLEMSELRVGAERVEGLRATVAFKGAELTVPRLTARRGGVPFQAEGAIALGGLYRWSLLPVKLNLAAFPPLTAVGGKGTVVLRAWGSGQWPEARAEGELALADLEIRQFSLGDGRARFALDGKRWRWELSLAQGVSARGVAPLLPSGPLQVEVTAADLDLTPFLRALRARLPFLLGARADGRATLEGGLPGLHDLAGAIELTVLRGHAGGIPWQSRGPARLTLEAGTLRFESLDLVGPGLSVTIKGSVRPGERTDLELSGHAPFPIVKPWVPPLEDLRGTPEVRVALAGAPAHLKVSGRAELARVDVKLKPLPLWVSVGTGEVSFGNDSVRYKVREGAVAAGRLEGEGTSRREGERWRHTIDFRVDRAQAEQLYDQLRTERRWASGELSARGSLTFDTAPGQAALRTLEGRLSLALEGGSLRHYPALVRIFGLLGSPVQPFRLPDLTRERMPFHRISADFAVKDGLMETKNFLLDSAVVRVSGVGTVSFPDQSVDLDLAVRPLQVLEQGIRKVPLIGRLLPQEQSLAVTYFDMEGPWADPTITPAPVKSLSQTVVDLLLLLLRAPERVLSPPR